MTDSPIARPSPTARPRRLRAAACMLLASGPIAAHATVQLQCRLEQGPTVIQVATQAVSDPYRVPPVRINTFRFKPVVVGTARQVAYIKLYTYYDTPRGALLLHEAKYVAPQPGPASLTGTVNVYEPLLGRELRYGCQLVDAAGMPPGPAGVTVGQALGQAPTEAVGEVLR
jgi:hypothetical protein